jgi:hypothetical protein
MTHRASAAERTVYLADGLRAVAATLQALANTLAKSGDFVAGDALDSDEEARISAQAERVKRRAKQHSQRKHERQQGGES